MEQLLKLHESDAERILINLGFLSHCSSVSTHLPQRFLTNTSKANGISVENYVKENYKPGNGVESMKVPEEHLTVMNGTLPNRGQLIARCCSKRTVNGTSNSQIVHQ